MSQFSVGDTVEIIAAGPENAGTVGQTGTVIDDGSLSGGEIAVKGIDGRLTEKVRGYRAYTADQLRKV
ncbi:hypothetical protein [Streptomyces sp. NPDC059916]|uniref:hypothetical protein n=1 Tax=Streptomyces sp. NPDC059916 TaxID=3347001 RepID=UPI0036C50D65